jgi:hypothetical protein
VEARFLDRTNISIAGIQPLRIAGPPDGLKQWPSQTRHDIIEPLFAMDEVRC